MDITQKIDLYTVSEATKGDLFDDVVSAIKKSKAKDEKTVEQEVLAAMTKLHPNLDKGKFSNVFSYAWKLAR